MFALTMRAAVVAVLLLTGCSRAPTSVNVTPDPHEVIPSRWIDLPDAPLAAERRDGKALLVVRDKQLFSSASVGCVIEQQGKTHVIATLASIVISDGRYGAGFPVDGLLASINNPEIHEGAGGKQCPADSYFAVVEVAPPSDWRESWTAEGTPWPRISR
jgi:hypothetical protein